jgi:hypothetical protein
MPSCQTILIRSPGASKDVKIAGMRVAPQHLLDLQRQPVHALRMSGRPTASHTHTPREPGSSPRQHVEHPLQHRAVNVAVDGTRRPPSRSISISPAFLHRRRRGASSTAVDLPLEAGNDGISLVISTATNDGSSRAPGTPITPSSASSLSDWSLADRGMERRFALREPATGR